jgi:hypothetical protein
MPRGRPRSRTEASHKKRLKKGKCDFLHQGAAPALAPGGCADGPAPIMQNADVIAGARGMTARPGGQESAPMNRFPDNPLWLDALISD